jgi:hypothetical protein
LQNTLVALHIGILRIEAADFENLRFTLTVSEDLDCSGLPLHGQTVCDYDEGFIAGILQTYTAPTVYRQRGGLLGDRRQDLPVSCAEARWARGSMNKEAQQYFADLEIYLRTLLNRGVEQAEALRPKWHGEVDGEDPAGCPELLQRFLDQALAAYSFQKQIASGDISQEMNTRNMLAMPLKGLQASHRHLAWQAEQVPAGDYNQTVHFLGGFSHSFELLAKRTAGEFIVIPAKAGIQNSLIF